MDIFFFIKTNKRLYECLSLCIMVFFWEPVGYRKGVMQNEIMTENEWKNECGRFLSLTKTSDKRAQLKMRQLEWSLQLEWCSTYLNKWEEASLEQEQ